VDAAAVTLVLAAAALHAGWNVALHGADDRVAGMAIAGMGGGLALTPFLLADPPGEVLHLAVLSGIAETAYVLALSAAYGRGALSLAYPVGRGTAPLLTTLGGWVLLSERPAPLALAGAAALGVGLSLLGLEARRSGSLDALGFALLVGVTITAYSLIDASAVRETGPPGYLAVSFWVQGVLTWAAARFDAPRLRAALRPGMLIAAGTTGAYLLVLFAFRLAPVGRVATLREVAVLLGILASGERPRAATWVGAALCVAGAVLVAA
jgi:drug/metabolite transporter (DMT)-like permease